MTQQHNIGIGIVSSLLMDSKRPIMHWALALDINFNIELKVPVMRGVFVK